MSGSSASARAAPFTACSTSRTPAGAVPRRRDPATPPARADLVHVQDALYGSSVAVLAAAKRRRTPSVLTQHVAFVPQHNAVLDAAQHVAIDPRSLRGSRRP